MNKVLKFLEKKGTTLIQASTLFGIPRTTLRSRLVSSGAYGRYKAKLAKEERDRNDRIVASIRTCKNYSQVAREFGLGREMIRKIAVGSGTRKPRPKRTKEELLFRESIPIDSIILSWGCNKHN